MQKYKLCRWRRIHNCSTNFLQRFILNKNALGSLRYSWYGIFQKYGGALNSGGATSYGVRLLNQLIEDNL